jgi:glycosyltransferase involved in cell wall biosynthesis
VTTVHFVYPSGRSISTPESIGRNVAERLRQAYAVVQYDWTSPKTVEPGTDDVLLGHPHPAPWTIFRRSARRPGWKRIVVMTPYNQDPRQMSFLDALVPRCDLYLAITGNYWFKSVHSSLFAHWAPKMVHVDLAIDRRDFPVIKTHFNHPGRRRFLYIGHDGWQKNPRYLEEIAARLPRSTISWMGGGTRLKGLRQLGHQDFASETARRLVATHDFVLTVGRFDANPTPVLEAMAWGLIPVCTPTSGYEGHPGIVNVPLDEPDAAASVLERLQKTSEDRLARMQAENWLALDSHFNWDRFAQQVVEAINSKRSPPTAKEGLGRKIRLRTSAKVSPYQRWNLELLARTVVRASRRH